uniref:Uncharacterized protein n=1 Tax=Kalanchoe fedtschenkoi TaxID=63787 RepID=A0A7N0UV00_KALFE
MIYEPTFPKYAGSNSFIPGTQNPYPFNFGDIDGSNLICNAPGTLDGNAANSNFNAGAAGGPFGYSGFGSVPGMVGDSSQATNINVAQNEDANPPFIDFLGVESKTQADH